MAKRRKDGAGTVRLRKDGRWEGRYVVGYDEKGYPKTKNVLAKTKKECIQKLDALKNACGWVKSTKVKANMRFGDWLEFWYEHYSKPKLRPTTQAIYEAGMRNHIIPELGAIRLDKLTQNDLQQFYTRMKSSGRLCQVERYGEGLSNRTVRACHATCRAALEKAVQEGLREENPAIGCKLPPKKTKDMQVLSREEMQRFLIQAKAENAYELFLLELATGLRRGEILALQWEDLNFETGELRINKQIYRVKGEMGVTEPKTKASIRTIILPPILLEVLKEYKKNVFSKWMFPSRVKDDMPADPGTYRRKLQIILELAQCKHVRFHDLRHTFATMALENGMDVKTLSTIIGHTSAATTLDIYTHITDTMREEAASNIDRGIGKVTPGESISAQQKKEAPAPQEFQAVKSGKRKPGTGCVTELNDHLYEGRYSPKWPDGKKHSRNVYAHTREECEVKLKELIRQMNAEIAAIKSGQPYVYPDGVSPKKKKIAAYMRANPGVTNKSLIAKETKVDRTTVQRYYDEIRAEFARQQHAEITSQ